MTYYTHRDRDGFTRGGIDVESAVNQFFKLLLLSPIILLAVYISLAMLKHMIFGGVPVMNQPTEQQREAIRERDHSINPSQEAERVVTPTVTIEAPSQEELPVDKLEGYTVDRAAELPGTTKTAEPEVVPFTIYHSPEELAGRE